MVRIDIIGLRLPKPFIKYDDGCDTKQVKIDLMNSFGMGMLKKGDKGVLTSTLDGDYQYEVNSTETVLSTGQNSGQNNVPALSIRPPDGFLTTTAETARLRLCAMLLMAGADSHSLLPTGIAFAVGPRLLLTARHNVRDDDVVLIICSSVVGKQGYGAKTVLRTNQEDRELDWLILELDVSAEDFGDYLALAPLDEIPVLSGTGCYVRALYATVRQYLRGEITSLSILSESYHRVSSYDPLPPEGTNTAAAEGLIFHKESAPDPRADPHKVIMSVESSLSASASGCPYLNEKGQVVAMHLMSVNDNTSMRQVWDYVKDAQKKEQGKTKAEKKRAFTEFEAESWDEVSHTCGDSKVGLVIAKIPKLVEALRKANVII